MKKLFVSAGLIAAGATSVQSVSAQSSSSSDVVSPKAWSVGASLRGFYDDNYDIGQSKKGSFGAELSPTISYNLPFRQTDMGIRYNYTLYYYEDRQERSNAGTPASGGNPAIGGVQNNPFDQSHQVDFWWDHAINENWRLNFTDTFGDGQEPELITPGLANQSATPYRVNGNNIGNHANLTLTTQWTRNLGTTLHYGNDFYDYHNKGTSPVSDGSVFPGGLLTIYPVGASVPGVAGYSSLSGNPSLAGLLDRVEQNVGFDFDWTFNPELTVMAGYSFSIANYIGNEPIAVYNYNIGGTTPRSLVYQSDSRDSLSHSVYVGGTWVINPNLTLLGTIGAQYTDSYNDPLNHDTSVSPTANISLNYTYATGSYLQVGVSQSQNATDVATVNSGGSISQYQESSVVYADINHRITSKLMGTLIGRYVYSTYQGGGISGGDDEFNVGVNLSYQISQHFNAEIGYNYDDLQSGVAGVQYDRNRVYFGVGATY